MSPYFYIGKEKDEHMNYEKFKEMILEKVNEKLPEEYRPLDITIESINSINGPVDRLVMSIQGSPIMSAAMKIPPLYRAYTSGKDFDVILQEIIESYILERKKRISQKYTEEITPERIRRNTVMILINAASNVSLLKTVPHRKFFDCAVIYRLILDTNKKQTASVIITNDIMEMAGLTEEKLFEVAAENTGKMLPPKIQTMKEILSGIIESFDEDEMKDMGIKPKDVGQILFPEDIWIITNERNWNGAVNMVNRKVVNAVADRMGDDLFLLPASIHEVLCIGASGKTPDDLTQLVETVNQEAVAVEERLSNQVYRYDRKSGKFSVASDNPHHSVIYETDKYV